APSKEEIIAHMSTFNQLGATHLAMEMIRDDQQEIVDAFLSQDVMESGRAFIRLYSILEKDWSWTSDAVELWLTMMRRAKRLGMKIVGIDKNMGDDDDTL